MDVKIIKKGDIFRLSDYRAIEEMGGPFQAVIENVERYRLEGLLITVMSFDYNGDSMALVAKTIGDTSEYFVYRMWEDGVFIDIIRDLTIVQDGEDLPEVFGIEIDGYSEYGSCSPFPLFGFKKEHHHYGIGEYVLQNEYDSTYWAINSLILWNISPDEDEDDTENYATLYFGWPVDSTEIEFIKGK